MDRAGQQDGQQHRKNRRPATLDKDGQSRQATEGQTADQGPGPGGREGVSETRGD